MGWETRILTKWAKPLTSGSGKFWKVQLRARGMPPLGHDKISSLNTGVSKRNRTIFKSLIHDCPCSRADTRTRLRNSCTKSKRTAQKPTNQQTSNPALTSQLASLCGRQCKPQPLTSKYLQKMAWWPQTRLKSFFGAPQPRTSKDHKRCVFRLSMTS